MGGSMEINCLLCSSFYIAQVVSEVVRDLPPESLIKAYKCMQSCHVQLYPFNSLEDNISFYNNASQIKNLTSKPDLSEHKQKTEADTKRRIEWVLSIAQLKQFHKPKILDVGCGYGFFLDALADTYNDTTELDISKSRIDHTKKNSKGYYINRKLDASFVSKNKSLFNIVTLFHVLEPVTDPSAFFSLCMELLRSKGVLLIEVPNLNDELIDHVEAYKHINIQRAHISYFNLESLSRLFQKSGYKDFSIRGAQRYGLLNLIHWIEKGIPQLTKPDRHSIDLILNQHVKNYRKFKEENLTCDILIA